MQSKTSNTAVKQDMKKNLIKNKPLEEQLKYLIELKDDEYKDSLLTGDLRKYVLAFEKEYVSILTDYKSHLAPSFRELKANNFNVS